MEINPNLCAAAEENFKLNGITTAHVLVCDSAKFANQVLRTKKYTLYAPASSSRSTEAGLTLGDASPENISKVVPANMSTRSKKKYEAALRHSARGSNKPVRAATQGPQPSTSAPVLAEDDLEAMEAPTDEDVKAVVVDDAVPAVAAPVERVPLYTFRFGAVLVDPPRCGLDALTLSLVAGYNHILYISCSPESLMRDLKAVSVVFLCISLSL